MTSFLNPMGAQDLRAAGIPEPWSFGMADRVRFGEIDALSHVNNAAYLGWFENLRIHYFRQYGLHDYEGEMPKIVIRNLSLHFKAEVKLNAEYILTGRTVSYRNSSFTMNYAVFVDGKITTSGDAVIVSLNQDNTKRPLDDNLITKFISRDGAVQS